jgi:hypothetical protein
MGHHEGLRTRNQQTEMEVKHAFFGLRKIPEAIE